MFDTVKVFRRGPVPEPPPLAELILGAVRRDGNRA